MFKNSKIKKNWKKIQLFLNFSTSNDTKMLNFACFLAALEDALESWRFEVFNSRKKLWKKCFFGGNQCMFVNFAHNSKWLKISKIGNRQTV